MDRFEDAFFREARSQIQDLNDGLLAVESNTGDVAIDELFRAAHSLKGSCRMQGLQEASELAHALEDALGAIRSGDIEPTAALIDEALAAVDLLEAVVRAEAAGDDLDRDVSSVEESLRSTLDEHRGTESTDETDRSRSTDRSDDEWNPEDSELSDDVVAALEATTEFDDIDTLLDDESGRETDEQLEGWGLLDEDVTDTCEETPDEAETPDDPTAFFEKTKSDLDSDGPIDSLQEDIDAVEFGEFDDDDDYTIGELLDLDPDESPPSEADVRVGKNEGAEESGGTNSTDGMDVEANRAESTVSVDPASADQPRVEPSNESTPSDAETDTNEPSASPPLEETAGEDTATEFVFGTSQDDFAQQDPDFDTEVTGEDEPDEMLDDRPTEVQRNDLEASIPPASDEMPDPDSVPETLLDVELSENLDGDADEWDSDVEMDVSVDEEMAEFESQFDELLDSRSTEETPGEGPTFRSAVGTIEESRLDTEAFPTAESSSEFGNPGGLGHLQEMTVDVETADQLLNIAEELSLTHLRLEEAVGPETGEAITEEISNLLQLVTEYRRTVMDVRLMPLRTAIEGIPRTVRDIARSQDKEVELLIEDIDVELDRGIINELRDPLVHIARNAVDHGIEHPDDRAAAGKPPEGTIEIQAERVDDRVIIEISDDGRGIEPEAIRQRAVDRDILTRKEVRQLTDTEVYDLVFEPGFTTREEVTDVSGRGVGMDVVKQTVADLNGTVTVDSESGEGTTVRLTVPVSIVFTEVLFIEVNSKTFGIPMSVVDQISETPPIRTDDGREVVQRSELDTIGEFPASEETAHSYQLIRLESVLDLQPTPADAEDGQVVWVSTENENLAIRCDRILTSQEVVVRPYGDLLRDVPGVSGATTLGNGDAVNVLDVGSL